MNTIEQLPLLHERLLIITREVHKICVANNIRYTLAGGSLIGAVRHKGFIPWDDDMDIMMPYDDYKRFLDIVFNMEHEWLEFKTASRTPGYYRTILKAYDKRTTLIQSDNDEPEGIYIDIFPYIYVGDSKKKGLCEYWYYRIIKGLIQRNTNHYDDKNPIKEFILTTIGKILPKRFLLWLLDIQSERLRRRRTKYSTDLEGKPRGIVPTECMEGFVLMPFENDEFYCFEHAHDYLTNNFGDYMTLPPLEKQKPENTAIFDVNTPYKEYKKK